MRYPILGLAALLLWALAPKPASSADPEIKTISPQEAAQRGGWIVIDVREPGELSEELGYIEGATNISLGRILLGQGLDGQIDKAAPLLIVCRTGKRSARAAAKAVAMGFSNVHSLEGGMVAWNEAGLKVQRAKSEDRPKPAFKLMTGVPCG